MSRKNKTPRDHFSSRILYEYWYLREGAMSEEIEMHLSRCELCQNRITELTGLLGSFGLRKATFPDVAREVAAIYEKISREVSHRRPWKKLRSQNNHLTVRALYEYWYIRERVSDKIEKHLSECRLCQRRLKDVTTVFLKYGRKRTPFRRAIGSILAILKELSK